MKSKSSKDLVKKFEFLVKINLSEEFLTLIRKSNIKELNLFILKCKDDIENKERVISFLNNEINRRIQNRVVFLSTLALVISFASIIISIFIKK